MMKFTERSVLRAAAIVFIAGYGFLTAGISVNAQVAQLKQEAQQKKPEADPRDMTVIGRVERVWISGANMVLKAKVDTGARTTSLRASKIETFKRGNKDWVRFAVLNQVGLPTTLERKVFKFQKIKKKNSAGTEVRPVVLLGLCVANIFKLTEVNLFDRSKFNYPVLIGRRFLFAKALVNVEQIYTAEPRCEEMLAG